MDNDQDTNSIEGIDRFFSFSPAMRHINKQSGSVCDGKEKSKKQQLKKLSALGEDYSSFGARGMGCAGSDGEDELRLSKRFKLPTKFSDDCNTVYHVTVPRKLRSAIKKRSYESISPALPVLKKLNRVADGLKLLKKDDLMKSNLDMGEAEGSARDAISGPITKDEEEVAEALYALAGLFPNNAQWNKNKLEVEQPSTKSSASPKAEGSVTPLEGPKGEPEPKTILHSSNAVGSATEVAILNSHNHAEQPDISIGKWPRQACSDVLEVNLPFPAFSENEYNIQRPSSESVILSGWTESSLEPGSKLIKPEKSLASLKYPETAVVPIASACSQPKEQCMIEENRDIGFSSRMSRDDEGGGIPLQSYTAKLPTWFESSSCISRSPVYSGNVTKKDAQIATNSKKSWRRCSTHIYITQFIKGLQTIERSKGPMQSALISSEGSKEGAHETVNGPIGTTNCLIGIISSDGSGCSAPEKNATEVRNAILLHKRLVQGQEQASTSSGICTAEKQSLDFLSLRTGSSGIEASNGTNKARQGPEALTPLRFPCLHSQHQPANPFPSPQNYYSSASFSGHPSAAAMQQVQLPAYVGRSPDGPPSIGATASSSLQSHRQEQQQKRAPLLMAHYSPGVAPPTRPDWQTGVPDPSPTFHHTQILFPPSRSSIEIIGSIHSPIMQQQQQQLQLQQHQGISTTAPLPPTVKGQYNHAPSFFEGNMGDIHSEGVPMRIICNQHI